MSKYDIGLFQATHAGHGIHRKEQPFREEEQRQFDEIPEYAEHWKPGAVFVWLHCPRCDTQILVDRVEGGPDHGQTR